METSEPLLPTPTAQADKQERMKKKQNDGRNRHSLFLSDAINLTSSQVASPASLFPKPDEDAVRKMIATSGRRCFESYENFIRGGSSVRTLAASLLGTTAWYSTRCSVIWKTQVIRRRRLLFRLAPLTPRTDEIGFGSSLAPTPRREDGDKGARSPIGYAKEKARWGRKNGEDLPTKIAMLPTPSARDYKGAGLNGWDTMPSLIERGATKGSTGTKTGLKLQPSFALWMMGFPPDWCDLADGEMPRSRGQAIPLSRKSLRKS